MKLTRYTDYSLRVMIDLGSDPECSKTITELAERHGISRNHVMKVVYELSCLGYLMTTRGQKGGVRLGRPAESINIGRLVRDTEKTLALVECMGAGNRCALTPACVLKGALGKAKQAFLNVLDEYTLADLKVPTVRLAELMADLPR